MIATCRVVLGNTVSTAELTSGIPGGYRLVSTYDLPDCNTIGGGGGKPE